MTDDIESYWEGLRPSISTSGHLGKGHESVPGRQEGTFGSSQGSDPSGVYWLSLLGEHLLLEPE